MEHQNEHHEPETGPMEPEPGIFTRINNYILLCYAAACFLMYISISGFLYLSGRAILSLSLPGIVGLLIPLFILSRRFSLSFADEYLLKSPDLLTAAMVLLVSGGAILPVDTLSSIFEREWSIESDYINFLLSIKPKGIATFIAVAFGTVLVTPLSEELLFRGFIQRIFQRNMPGPLAVLLAGTVFGLCHFNLTILPGVILLGIILGYIFLRTGNLAYTVMAHALHNLVSLVRLHFTTEDAIRAGEVSTPPHLWTLVSVMALVTGILYIERKGQQARDL